MDDKSPRKGTRPNRTSPKNSEEQKCFLRSPEAKGFLKKPGGQKFSKYPEGRQKSFLGKGFSKSPKANTKTSVKMCTPLRSVNTSLRCKHPLGYVSK
jgi:hypothetical protein